MIMKVTRQQRQRQRQRRRPEIMPNKEFELLQQFDGDQQKLNN